jgi:hypothetical protein
MELAVHPLMQEVNLCTINRIEEDSVSENVSCKQFNQHVLNLQATIVYNYQITAKVAIMEKDPGIAAKAWREYMQLCDKALLALDKAKSRFPECVTDDLYDLALTYRDEALSRHHENSQDAEWLKTAQSNPLFQAMIGQS